MSGRKKLVAYISAPLTADTPEEFAANRARAARWVAWAALMGLAPSATWIVLCDALSNEHIELCFQIDFAHIEKSDIILLVGGRVSNGMQREADHAREHSIPVADLTFFGAEPPQIPKEERDLRLSLSLISLLAEARTRIEKDARIGGADLLAAHLSDSFCPDCGGPKELVRHERCGDTKQYADRETVELSTADGKHVARVAATLLARPDNSSAVKIAAQVLEELPRTADQACAALVVLVRETRDRRDGYARALSSVLRAWDSLKNSFYKTPGPVKLEAFQACVEAIEKSRTAAPNAADKPIVVRISNSFVMVYPDRILKNGWEPYDQADTAAYAPVGFEHCERYDFNGLSVFVSREKPPDKAERRYATQAPPEPPLYYKTPPSACSHCSKARCKASSDGECSWAGCPQLHEGEPAKSGRHCPLDHHEKCDEE